jgi:hypothetical protein
MDDRNFIEAVLWLAVHGCAMARFAVGLRTLEDRVQPLRSVGQDQQLPEFVYGHGHGHAYDRPRN